MMRYCTACGDAFSSPNGRKTCGVACDRARRATGGATPDAAENRKLGRQSHHSRQAGRVGGGRSVMTERGLTVDDPAALAAQGVVMVDCWGGEWAPL